MSIEERYSQCPRSSGAQCIYTTEIYSNYAIMTKISTYVHSSFMYGRVYYD